MAYGGRYTEAFRVARPLHAAVARACMQQSILVIVLALMVFAVALDLRIEDLRYVARSPVVVGAGLVARFLLLPVGHLARHPRAAAGARQRGSDDAGGRRPGGDRTLRRVR